jgi:hypothetical protein
MRPMWQRMTPCDRVFALSLMRKPTTLSFVATARSRSDADSVVRSEQRLAFRDFGVAKSRRGE